MASLPFTALGNGISDDPVASSLPIRTGGNKHSGVFVVSVNSASASASASVPGTYWRTCIVYAYLGSRRVYITSNTRQYSLETRDTTSVSVYAVDPIVCGG